MIEDLLESPGLPMSVSEAKDGLRVFGTDSVIAALTMRESYGVNRLLLA